MTLPLVLTDEARQDMVSACHWYQAQSASLDQRLICARYSGGRIA